MHIFDYILLFILIFFLLFMWRKPFGVLLGLGIGLLFCILLLFFVAHTPLQKKAWFRQSKASDIFAKGSGWAEKKINSASAH